MIYKWQQQKKEKFTLSETLALFPVIFKGIFPFGMRLRRIVEKTYKNKKREKKLQQNDRNICIISHKSIRLNKKICFKMFNFMFMFFMFLMTEMCSNNNKY